MSTVVPWRVRGEYFESCNCVTACPCVFRSPPTDGECHSLQAYHITEGHYGEVSLVGLTAVQVLMVGGHFWTGRMEVILYIDEQASPPQREALEAIFSGQAGGPYKFPGRLIQRVQRVEYAPMRCTVGPRGRRFWIPGVMDFTLEALDCGTPDRLTEIRGSMHFVDPVYVAKAVASWFRGAGHHWDHTGRSGFFGVFDLAGP
ncbi:MAG: DUF1326 domain-containing protein [Armatimonadota bacterium]|nr:DUF1326 domain-containing protein [Armatimonadota bacterium]MDR7485717.1 DUF1326 domain-containing protein [Armatimonadota bacterium]MDR7534166.1 DUF1326 domain-containing protein [Armatimonadota bacterium]MDR7536381.1 DUF1326 domain-containing protein [Armatimonadota bacterium]